MVILRFIQESITYCLIGYLKTYLSFIQESISYCLIGYLKTYFRFLQESISYCLIGYLKPIYVLYKNQYPIFWLNTLKPIFGRMSVLIETSLGDIVIDLLTKERPRASLNFLKLCKLKMYNFCLFHNIQRNFMIQSG